MCVTLSAINTHTYIYIHTRSNLATPHIYHVNLQPKSIYLSRPHDAAACRNYSVNCIFPPFGARCYASFTGHSTKHTHTHARKGVHMFAFPFLSSWASLMCGIDCVKSTTDTDCRDSRADHRVTFAPRGGKSMVEVQSQACPTTTPYISGIHCVVEFEATDRVKFVL